MRVVLFREQGEKIARRAEGDRKSTEETAQTPREQGQAPKGVAGTSEGQQATGAKGSGEAGKARTGARACCAVRYRLDYLLNHICRDNKVTRGGR